MGHDKQWLNKGNDGIMIQDITQHHLMIMIRMWNYGITTETHKYNSVYSSKRQYFLRPGKARQGLINEGE